ncbi:RING finger protein B [Phytophthora cinnamomi]|uniref:RING finger protein B n=1 Tax=Phytophthora cinnamomi TaxID=4785 RepID=UPI00355A6CBD|nr:RING finger protein B [Phytophthora cinnamomi]
MAPSALVELSAEILEVLEPLLDVEALVHLSITCRFHLEALRALTEARCKRECFTTYLYPTVASYRMQAAVPATWRQLYAAFSSLRGLRWEVCKADGASSSLRALKSDNQEYESDTTASFLVRSGGHYWFSVLQARIAGVTLGGEQQQRENSEAMKSSRLEALPFLQSPQQITMGKWEKIRAAGKGPCPRRNHSMTCLTNARCARKLLMKADAAGHGTGEAVVDEEESVVNVRRIIFFGGQSEGIPFEAFGDLYLLCIEDVAAGSEKKAKAAWIEPNVVGKVPSPRCGHTATLLCPELLMITGGSMGVSPILTLDVFLLHISGCSDFRWSTPSCSSRIPTGRSLHDVYRVSDSEVIIFGGRQIRQSNGLLDVHRLQVTTEHDDLGDTAYSIEWSEPRLSGSLPCSRRGHSTNTIGPRMLLFGGQDESTGQLQNDVRVLNIAQQRWQRLDVPGEAPCPRRGFKNQYFGTTLVISSGFVRSTQAGKVDHQLPDSDVHVLSLL